MVIPCNTVMPSQEAQAQSKPSNYKALYGENTIVSVTFE